VSAGRLAALLIGAGVVFASVLLVLLGEPPGDPVGPGSPAPSFRLPRLHPPPAGREVSLEELRGKAVLLNFWATWCKPCEEEMPAMERLYQALRGEPFELLAVSVDEDPAVVEAFRARLGLSFPILHDPDKKAARAYQVFKYPETLLVDRSGMVVARFIGPREWDAEAYVDRVRQVAREGAAP